MIEEKLSSVLSGVAGEYYVAAKLSSHGHLASITLRNTKGVDILCSNGDATKSIAIQVKTNRSSARQWVLTNKSEDFYADNLYYVFVNLNDGKKFPDFFVVPSKTVANHIKTNHKTWLDTPGKQGQVHKDNSMRNFTDLDEKYLDNWNVLGL
jgi:hypothetical protein